MPIVESYIGTYISRKIKCKNAYFCTMPRSKETSLRASYTLLWGAIDRWNSLRRPFETAHPPRKQLAPVIHQCRTKNVEKLMEKRYSKGLRIFTSLRERTKLCSKRQIPISTSLGYSSKHLTPQHKTFHQWFRLSTTITNAIPAPQTRVNHTCHQHDHQSQGSNHVEINFQRGDNCARIAFSALRAFKIHSRAVE